MSRTPLLPLLFSFLFAPAIATALEGIIECDRQGSPFFGCYLTREDPWAGNLATLWRGCTVEILGRSGNGRWQVRVSRTDEHVSGGAGGAAGRAEASAPLEGWVNPAFLRPLGEVPAELARTPLRELNQDALGALGGGASLEAPAEPPMDETDPAAAAALIDPERALAPGIDPWQAFGRLIAMPSGLAMPAVELRRGDLAGLVEALNRLLAHLSEAKGQKQISEGQYEGLTRRVGLIRDFLVARQGEGLGDDPRRLAAVMLAMSQVDQVRARQGGDVDPATGKRFRVGWQRLMAYFTVAFERMWPALEAQIRYVKNPYPPHWCGIFCWWALKSAGYDLPPWPMGKGIYGSVPNRPRKTEARVGDISYDGGKYDHMSLVVSHEGDGLHTIDGNTIRDDRPVGGEVWDKPKKRLSAIHSIFSPVRDW